MAQPVRKGGKRQSGFTLLEVLIAIGILSMSLTSLLTSQMASMRATRYAQGVTAAAFLAESKLIDIDTDKEYVYTNPRSASRSPRMGNAGEMASSFESTDETNE